MNRDSQTMLAIDTVLGSGSVSLWVSGTEISHVIGDSTTPLSETLLDITSQMFSRHGIEPNAVDLIAVSLGPGSYTGIRVGVSTAIGLAHSTGAEIAGVPTLRALAESGKAHSGSLLVAINAGREEMISQIFEIRGDLISAIGNPKLVAASSMIENEGRPTVVDNGTFEIMQTLFPKQDLSAIDIASDNVASLVASAALAPNGTQPDLTPIYTREFSFNKSSR